MPYWDSNVPRNYWKNVNLALLFINKAPGFFFFFFQRIDKKKKISHALRGTMPTLADGTVAVIMLNLVQVLLYSSPTVTSSLMKLHRPQFKHYNTGDVFVFTWVTAVRTDEKYI